MIKIGVLALQGDVREHVRALSAAGAEPLAVKRADQLKGVDALVLPGGESTTIGKLLKRFDLFEPLRDRISDGLPLYGTCAGAILLANEVTGREDAPDRLGVLDMTVRRNAYGRQLDSFEADLEVTGLDEPFRAVFIRAPVIERVGSTVEVLAEFDGSPVLARGDNVMVSTFHPEMTPDARVHEMFLEFARKGAV